MAADHPRRASAAAAPPPSIPPAPPLPPQKPYTARNAFARFVTQPFATYGSRPPSAQANRVDGGRINPRITSIPGTSAPSSQDASYKTGIEIAALDINHDRSHAILAGKKILKTISISGTKCTEVFDLRRAVLDYSSHNTGSRQREETLEIHDVKWSHGQYNTYIATAARNGKVIIYDLNRAGVELARLHEHPRQVHTVAFNPHQGFLLLSGSHDASVKLWDLRALKKEVLTCTARKSYNGNSEGVRDVRWSPTDGAEFAFGTDNGVIQRWDYRFPTVPKLKINAHDGNCYSVDWHPDGKHLLSAGSDKTAKVWDFSSEQRRQKPAWVVRAPYPIYNARWRPPYWSQGTLEHGIWQCTQFACSYDRAHSVVHIWDFRRSFLPFREINKYSTAPSDMLWHSKDLLWTVGPEGMFTQSDVHFAPKVLDRRNMQAFAVSPTGEVAGFAQTRPRRRISGIVYRDDSYITDPRDRRPSPDKSSFSRSSADDSIDESFLSSSFRKHHGRTSSNRSAKSLGSTPPSTDNAKVMYLADSLAQYKDSQKANQVAFRGALPGEVNISVFTYLAQKYKAIPLPDPPTLEAYLSIRKVFEQNAKYAQRPGYFRLAESWRILGLSVYLAVKRGATERKRGRLEQRSITPSVPSHDSAAGKAVEKGPLAALKSTKRGTHVSGPTLGAPESSSNVPTPLARPSTSFQSPTSNQFPLPDPDHDQVSLPPALLDVSAPEDIPHLLQSESRLAIRRSSFSGPRWYGSSQGLDERRTLMSSWRTQPRTLVTLDGPNTRGIGISAPPPFGRHNSDESFAMFSASTDSQRGSSMPNSLASGQSQSPAYSRAAGENRGFSTTSNSVGTSPTQSRSIPHSRSMLLPPKFSPLHEDLPDERNGKPPDAPSVLIDGSPTHSRAHISYSETNLPSLSTSAQQSKAIQDIETLRRNNNQLMRHYSSESEAILSSRGSVPDRLHIQMENMEASGTIVPEGPMDHARSPKAIRPADNGAGEVRADLALPTINIEDEPLILADFFANNGALSQDVPVPFTIIEMLRELLAFHTGVLCDAQTPSHMILLLTQLLPPTNPLPAGAKQTLLALYSDYLSTIGLAPGVTQAILNTHLKQLIETGIDPLQAESILETYHTKLQSLGLFNAATSLRRLAYPTFPAVYEQALKDTEGGLFCLDCKKPINNSHDRMQCESCHGRQAPCPVCWSLYPPFKGPGKLKGAKRRQQNALVPHRGILKSEHTPHHTSTPNTPVPSNLRVTGRYPETNSIQEVENAPVSEHAAASGPKPTLWSWCLLCGHGAHFACLSTWFADGGESQGSCPTLGCLCDCACGPRRDERLRAVDILKAERERGKVRSDDWKVSESSAVAGVRSALNAGEKESSGSSGGFGGVGMRRVRVLEPGGSGVVMRGRGDRDSGGLGGKRV